MWALNWTVQHIGRGIKCKFKPRFSRAECEPSNSGMGQRLSDEVSKTFVELIQIVEDVQKGVPEQSRPAFSSSAMATV